MAGMDKRLALVALWAAFAAAAVGVGFGAAGLVGGPFSDGVADAAGIDPSQQAADLDNTVSPGPEPSSTSTPTSSARAPSPATTPDPGPANTKKPPRTNPAPAASTRSVPARSGSRSITTRGGLVSATCRSGLVQVSGSPAVGWEIEDIARGTRRDARVRFERPDGDGRVEVAAACSGGAPRFSLNDDDGRGEDGGGDDSDDDDDEREGDEDRD